MAHASSTLVLQEVLVISSSYRQYTELLTGPSCAWGQGMVYKKTSKLQLLMLEHLGKREACCNKLEPVLWMEIICNVSSNIWSLEVCLYSCLHKCLNVNIIFFFSIHHCCWHKICFNLLLCMHVCLCVFLQKKENTHHAKVLL